ncbi:MAG: T9SS type A sorting domain-containing protein, partial [Bacteroidales bacterium]|nr:T9SS type A sorting domain-containing protein [Bacteroidales bacterium]MCF8352071.1 T9SS type A sorting domain-containing protein [Bacteroidales bacterium]MCF8376967.1 T9SS type A sorting domain-containing protein [Bacteroidales bacterium]MCF8401309.1 T9SS type A sorting domain-containing protein [Bacteroidales bacterium]
CEGISDTVYIMSTVGVDEVFTNSSVSVYPNPAQDLVNIESTFDISKLTVMNYVGQTVAELKKVEAAVVRLNTASYEDGVYFIKVETTEGIITKKITIAR